MKTTTLFRHRNLGGAWTITTTPRYPDSEKLAPEFDVVATFSGSEAGQIGLGAFIAGLRCLIGASLYNEETRQFDVGTIAQLDAA